MSKPTARLLLASETQSSDLSSRLQSSGYIVSFGGLAGIAPEAFRQAQFAILELSAQSVPLAQNLLQRIRLDLADWHVPILCLLPTEVPPHLLLDVGADFCLPISADEETLLAQIRAGLRIYHTMSRLSHQASVSQNLHAQLQSAHQQIDGDLELTRRIHRGFLPRKFPEIYETKIGICYRPRSRVGGDFYDVFRLDEEHIGFYLADAMGRGLPASSLLSIYVKKALRTKEISGHNYRLIDPNEVLAGLNRELVNLQLPEPPFVTMLYGILNCRDGVVLFSRAAHPHPIYVPANGDPPTYWTTSGTLLGVFDAEFPLQRQRLQSGDKLVLYSDGVHPPGNGPGSTKDSLLEATQTHRHLSAQPFVDYLARELLEQSRHPEDFSILTIEYHAPTS